jgi:phage tail-like protein
VTDFAELLYRTLPGIYRQKDELGELARFLSIVAAPLEELESSIAQLHEDLFAASARPELLPLVGSLIGAELERSLPASLQRATLEGQFAFYRRKGLSDPLARDVEVATGWPTRGVDFSQVVARLPYLQELRPVLRRRGLPVAEQPPGSGNFYFAANAAVVPLYDERRGRAIRRAELADAQRAAELVGTDAGFQLSDRGVPLLGAAAPAPGYRVLAADLGDFANPRSPAGGPLAIGNGEIAVDPELGRFRIAVAAPLAGNLRADFHQLLPASIPLQTVSLRDGAQLARLGRSDDLAPYSVDLRSPRRPSERIGRAHFDNHGFFLTFGRRVANQRPNHVAGPPSGRAGFSFDGRPLPANDPGVPLLLIDGLDGCPLTRRKLEAELASYAGQPRGFSLQVAGAELVELEPAPRFMAANLADFAQPRTPAGAPLALAATDVAVDPELGRFSLDLGALALDPSALRVGYQLGPSARFVAAPAPLAGGVVFCFSPRAEPVLLRDGFDGNPLSVKLRLGSTIASFHGTPRGYGVWRNGADLTLTLAPELRDLQDETATAAPGKLAIDLDRGRFALPAGLLQSGDVLQVAFSAEDQAAAARVLEHLAQRLPRMLPAGVVPVIIDSRRSTVDPELLV